MPRTRVVTLDVDAHLGWGEEARLIREEQEGNRNLSRAGALRKIAARRAWSFVEDLRARFGEACVVESSDRGIHVSFLLARAARTDRAIEVGNWILSEVGRREGPQAEGISIEVFPKLNARGRGAGFFGRSCRMPLTGGGRLLGVDLSTAKHAGKQRTLDVQELLLAPKLSIDGIPGGDDDGESTEAKPEEISSEPSERAVPFQSPELARDSIDEDLRAACSVKLRGDAFASCCLALEERGIPDDASFGASSKFAALLLYAGADERSACLAWDRFIERGGHRATHAESESGKRALSRTFRWWFRKGEKDPRVRRGALRRRDLVELAGRLLYAESESLRAA